MSAVKWPVCKHNTCTQMFPDFIQPTNLPKSESCDYSIWVALQQLVYHQGHRLSETSPEQLLGLDQPRTDAIDQWSKRLLLVFRSQGGDTGHYFD